MAGRNLFKDKSAEYLQAIGSKAKYGMDAAITGIGSGLNQVSELMGAETGPQGIYKDADGNEFDSSGKLVKAAQNTYAESVAENKAYPYGRPEVKQDYKQKTFVDQQIADALTSKIGRPSTDPVEVAKRILDQSGSYSDEIKKGY